MKETQACAESQVFGNSIEQFAKSRANGIPEATGPAHDLGSGVTSTPWEHGIIVKTSEGKVFVINEAAKSFEVFDKTGALSTDKLADLRKLISSEAANASNPEVQAVIKDAFIDALNDHSINFKDLRNLMDRKGDPPSPFDFVRVKEPGEPDADVVASLQQRARYEIEQNPHVFTDNKQLLEKVFNDLRNGGDPKVLKQDIVNAVNRDLTSEEKAAALQVLAEQNDPVTKQFLLELDQKFGTESKTNQKEFQKILEKAIRDDTLKKKPWFEVENIGDSFRFRTIVPDLKDLSAMVQQMTKEFADHDIQILNIDAKSLVDPKQSGWRSIYMDVRYPNGQIAEYQITPKALADVPENHADYEYLRLHPDPTTPEEIAKVNEIEQRSNRIFGEAWAKQLKQDGMSDEQVRQIIAQIQASTPSAY
jgi:hypothetical protein